MTKLFKSLFLSILAAIVVSCGNGGETPPPGPPGESAKPPGVVVNHAPKTKNIYLGSPGISILPDDSYVISHDEGGSGTVGYPNITRIYKSVDKGETWTRISSITTGHTWSNIFMHKGALYVMGMRAPIANCLVRRSTDGGVTWTEPTNAEDGLVLSWRSHSAPVPMILHNGRIWRGLEVKNPLINAWPSQYNAMVMSAPVDSDLMKATSWTKSNQLTFNSSYLGGIFGGWLEGNTVVGPDGEVKLVMRVEIPNSMNGEYVAIINVSGDGSTITFDPAKDFVNMPGGAKKFTIRYDESSERYWTLSNYVDPKYKYMNPGKVRNKLALCSSVDLRTWMAHKLVLEHDDVTYHAFQYVDWVFDGNDMIFASRTAYDDDYGGASSAHDANYITFHRVGDFRSEITKNIE